MVLLNQKTKITLYLLGNIECSAISFWMVPVAAKNLTKNRIVRLLQALQCGAYNKLANATFQHSEKQD